MNLMDHHSQLLWQNYYQDGLPDMYVGLMAFLFGFFTIVDSTSFLAIAFLLGSILLRQLKLHVVDKRTPDLSPLKEFRKPIVPIILLFSITFVLLIVSIRNTLAFILSWDFWLLITMMILFMGTFIFISFKSRSVRYFFYAGLCLISGLINVAPSGLATIRNVSHFLIMLAVIPLFIGMFLYIRFLRQVSDLKSEG